ncbi:MAG: PAS domain S-box protein [Thermodesulfovibrionales bacterium]
MEPKAGRDVFIKEGADKLKAEETAQQTETRMRMAMAAARQGFFEIDIRTDNVVVSPGYVRMIGYEPDEFPKRWFDLIHPDDLDTARLIYQEYISGRRDDCQSEFRQRTKSGQWMWVLSVSAVVEWNSDGIPTRIFGIYTDITERKKAEEALRNSEQFIRRILDTVDEGFIVIDRDFRILTANRAYCSQVGESCDSVVGRYCYEVSHKTCRPCFEEGEECAVRHVFETGEPCAARHRHPAGEDTILFVETKAFPIKDITGAVTSVIETVNNITEKHLLEEERLKTQKLEAIGTLAGGIAHDFNNLLQGIFGYISMAKITLDEKGRSLAMLEQAEQALHLSVNLTTQLLTFSKGGKPAKKKISLRPLIENSVRFALSGSSVDYRIKLDEDLWLVDADEGQLGQVVQNIVLNADQAMPVGGTILVRAKNVLSPDNGLQQLLGEGRYIEISVQDSGIGISEKYLEKIFDPYFTTKEKGSGLGLATSYSIIRNHGGLIDVKSEVGKGTTFYIYLPAVESEAEAPQIPKVSSSGRRGRVLIMDDEELVRNVAQALVKVLGNEVEVVENGEAAVNKYISARASGKPFDIVILDLTIRGGLGGLETVGRLLEIDPGVRAIVSSGYSDNAVVADYQNYGFKARLNKPYKLEELRNTLNALLT